MLEADDAWKRTQFNRNRVPTGENGGRDKTYSDGSNKRYFYPDEAYLCGVKAHPSSNMSIFAPLWPSTSGVRKNELSVSCNKNDSEVIDLRYDGQTGRLTSGIFELESSRVSESDKLSPLNIKRKFSKLLDLVASAPVLFEDTDRAVESTKEVSASTSTSRISAEYLAPLVVDVLLQFSPGSEKNLDQLKKRLGQVYFYEELSHLLQGTAASKLLLAGYQNSETIDDPTELKLRIRKLLEVDGEDASADDTLRERAYQLHNAINNALHTGFSRVDPDHVDKHMKSGHSYVSLELSWRDDGAIKYRLIESGNEASEEKANPWHDVEGDKIILKAGETHASIFAHENALGVRVFTTEDRICYIMLFPCQIEVKNVLQDLADPQIPPSKISNKTGWHFMWT
ncbi:hypothetical protein HGA88_05050 [Candidatus Roizmanbacteria bacterium]|nr:hypothetical protein [Candidatus Roizmanbacteria bacterium]